MEALRAEPSAEPQFARSKRGFEHAMSAALKTPRIRVFTLDGVFQRAFGTSGQAIGEPGHPMNLTIHGGELYVAEYFNDHIQGFDVPDRDHSMREASWFPPVPATPHAAQGPLV